MIHLFLMIMSFVLFGGYGLFGALAIAAVLAVRDQNSGRSAYLEGRDVILFFPILAGGLIYFGLKIWVNPEVQFDLIERLNDLPMTDSRFAEIIDRRNHTHSCGSGSLVGTAECAVQRLPSEFTSFFFANYIATIVFIWGVWLSTEILSVTDKIVRNPDTLVLPLLIGICLCFVPILMWETSILEGFMTSRINGPSRWPFIKNLSFWMFGWIGWQFIMSYSRFIFESKSV